MLDPKTILLVEDDADTSAALLHLVTGMGYSVVTADDGQQALDLIEAGLRPQLMLIDLMLPHVSGWDLIAYLQKDRDLRHTPTIVITGAPTDQIRVVADAILSKPLDFERLMGKISQLISSVHTP